MTNAEVAKLAVQLDLKGNFTSSLGAAEKQLGGFGTAMGHATSKLKNLATVGLAALGVGVFTVTGFFEKGIAKASEFAFSIEKLQGLTNDSADSLSQLIAVTDNYGISADRLVKVVGFAEKSLGNIALATDGAKTFLQQYGFAITDATGKVLPFNTILMKAADFYNSNAAQSTKAALAAKLFGRNYTDLVPILKLGSKGIQDAEAAAKALGITLTQTNVADLAKFREATRTLGDAMTGLQLQIGLVLVPTITELATTITTFVSSHRTDIVTFFRNALQAAKDAGKVIGGLVGTISGFWNSIPPELRDLMTKGLIADRTVKFLFGFSPLESVGGTLFGNFFARGSSPANPMFVSGGGLGGASGGLGLLAGAAIAVSIVGIAAEVADALAFRNQRQDLTTNFNLTNAQALALQIEQRGGVGSMDARSRAGALTQFMNAGTTYAAALAAAHAMLNLSGKLVETQNAGDKYIRDNTFALTANTAKLGSLPSKLRDQLGMSVKDVISGIRERSAAKYGGTGLGAAAVDATFVRDELRLSAKIAASSEDEASKLADLKKIQSDLRAHGDRIAARKLDRLISTVQHQKPPVVNLRTTISVNGQNYLVSTTTRTVSASISSTQRFQS